MDLIFSSPEFKIRGFSYTGFPILLTENNKVFTEGLNFLIYHCFKRGRVQSRRSWDTFGRDLYDFFAFLECHKLDWRQVESRTNETLLAVYRDWSFVHCNLSASTVNRRLRLAIKFYQYALEHEWIGTLPYEMEAVLVRRPKGFLAHTDCSGGLSATPDVMLRATATKIKVLNGEQIAELLKAIKSPTLHLIVRLALTTGLRKEELLTIPVTSVVNPRSTSARSHIVVDLNPQEMSTKGGKPRMVDVPVSLMSDLWEYVLHERQQAVARNSTSTNRLFVTAHGEGWSVQSRTLNNQLKALNLPFPCNPHIFRHTYATHTLKSLRSKPGLSFEPLLYVRDRLGHASITTTEMYLHFLDQIEDDLRTQYQQEIDEICEELAKE